MKNRKLLLLLTAPSLLVVGCTPENSSSSKDSVPSSSSTVVTSSPSKEGSIRNANDLRALVTENMALPTSALRYTYEEKMPNETEAHTIFDTYDVKMTQNENFVRLVQEGKETPIERYAGILIKKLPWMMPKRAFKTFKIVTAFLSFSPMVRWEA